MISHLIWLIVSNNLDVNKFHTFYIAYDACDRIPQSVDLIQSIYLKSQYDLEWDLWLYYLSKWNTIKATMESFPKTKLLVDEFINDQVNDEIEWTFHGFELEESTWEFQIKTKFGPIVWIHCFKNMVIIGKVFQEGFFCH